jgi:malonyl-CoA O-methyltransferase
MTQIARSFARAARSYDAHSAPQRHAAARLAELIAADALPPRPRVLEIGCGTGHLTGELRRRLPDAVPGDTASHNFFCSDIAAPMLAVCRERLPDCSYLVMDGERPAVAGGFDLVCSNLTAQWFRDLPAALAGLAALLAPGGLLALSTLGAGSFHEWNAAHAALGLAPGTRPFVDAAALRQAFPPGTLTLDEETFIDRAEAALELPRRLRAIGAAMPAAGHRPLSAGALRRVLRMLGPQPALSYRILFARFRKATA